MKRTKFEEIKFDEWWHSYSYRGKKLEAVTKVCARFKKPFARDYWARRKAEERGVTVAEILAEWEAKGMAARQKGDQVHEYIKQVLESAPLAVDDPFMALNQRPAEAETFGRLWNERLSKFAEPCQCEWIVGDAALGIGGTVDAVLRNQDTKKYHIFDWKTNQKFTTDNQWGQKLLPPFDDLDECDLNYYSLQVSLYHLILERNTDFSLDAEGGLGASYVVHLAADGYRVHQTVDFRERLLGVLERNA